MRRLLVSLVMLAACSSTTTSGGGGGADVAADTATDVTVSDVAAKDVAAPDTSVADVAPADTAPADTAPADAAAQDTGGKTGEFGFVIRKPASHKVTCTGAQPPAPTDMTANDADWLCAVGGGKYLYVQATPTDCKVIMNATASFTVTGAWLSDGTTATPLQNASYDWGGNHHNDSIKVDVADAHWEIYHSSFGFGWRACQPMDCLQLLDGAGQVTDDGCTSARTKPVVCVAIDAQGGHPELKDTFAKCPGDPNP